MTPETSALRIVPARPDHRAFVRSLSGAVFARFGDYETMLPRMMRRPGVHSWIGERQGRPVGFVMLSTPPEVDGDAELTAIAVAGESQGAGVGRALLAHVELEAAERLPGSGAAAVSLTVARDNLPARKFFTAAGYRELPGAGGGYPAGQPSMTMRKLLRDPRA